MIDARARRRITSPEAFRPLDLAQCNQLIHRRFEQQVARAPHAVAVVLPSSEVTYGQLNRAANRAARRLLALVKSSPRPIALLIPQGYASIVWTLAILKAGRAYAPLDQRLPSPVLREMLHDLSPGAVIAAGPHLERARSLWSCVPVLAAERAPEDGPFAADNLELPPTNQPGYVFYTSGSTGRAKGVQNSHRSVLHNVLRYTNTLRFAPGDRLSLVQNPSFSGTVSSLFGALLNGAAIVPFDLDGDGLATLSDAVRRSHVTVFHAVPSIFRTLNDPIGRFPDVESCGSRATAQWRTTSGISRPTFATIACS